MKSVTLCFHSSSTLPNTGQDGKKFLLCWGGWQYGIARWSVEREMFYGASGDYIENDNAFVYAELPENLIV